MKPKFMKSELPPIYKRNKQDAYLDPIRQKLILVTPEETVRQHAISYLINNLQVPKEMIRVEEPLSHYGVKSKGRADIVIDRYDEVNDVYYSMAVIECKAPDVVLDEKAMNQMIDYADALTCDYCMMINGEEFLCCKFENNEYITIADFPSYEEMLNGKYKEISFGEPPSRLKFNELEDGLEDYVDGGFIGENTPRQLALPMINFLECLLYIEHKFPVKKYNLFNLIEDYGVRFMTYGNASGGKFTRPYRSFLINYKDNTEFVSISMSAYGDIDKMGIHVAIDNEKLSHHSLQLVVEDNIEINGNRINFYHHGKITVANKGAAPIDGLRKLVVKEYPKIIDGDIFYLGSLTNNKLWNLDDPEVMNLVENLISYALIRDEYRAYVKSKY